MPEFALVKADLAAPRGLRRLVAPFGRWLGRLFGIVPQPPNPALPSLEHQVEDLRAELMSLTPLVAQVSKLRSDVAQFDFLTVELRQVRGEIHRLGQALNRLQGQVQPDGAPGRDRPTLAQRLAVLEEHVESLLARAEAWGADPGRRRPRAA